MDYEKIFANDGADKGLISKRYKELSNKTKKKHTQFLKMGRNPKVAISLKKTYRLPVGTWNGQRC